MKKGDLVRRAHAPFNYGIIVEVTWRAVWVWWSGDNTRSGYEPSSIHLSLEVVSENRRLS